MITPLPCPFCGRPAKQSSRASDHTKSGSIHFVFCFCGGYAACAHKTGESEEEVVSTWNTRHMVITTSADIPKDSTVHFEKAFTGKLVRCGQYCHDPQTGEKLVCNLEYDHFSGHDYQLEKTENIHLADILRAFESEYTGSAAQFNRYISNFPQYAKEIQKLSGDLRLIERPGK